MDFLRQQKYNFPFSCYIYWLCLLCFDLWHVLSDILIILLFMTFSLNRQLDLCCLQPVLWQVQIRFPLSFPFVSSWKNGLINFFADKPFGWWNDERGLSISRICSCIWICTCLSHLYPCWKVGWPSSLRTEGLADERGLSASSSASLSLSAVFLLGQRASQSSQKYDFCR